MWNEHSVWQGKSNPGFQVLLSVYNAEKFIKRCFDSLNKSMQGEDWLLLIGNDCSTDNTILEIMEHMPQSSAKKVHVFDYPKASTVGQAKNRLIKEAHNFKIDYPAILMMDGDDEMTPERPKLIKTAIDKQSQYVVGGWQRFKQKDMPKSDWDLQSSKNSASAARNLQFGPWATLFHCDFLPPNGKFFPEDEINNCGYEDLLTWHYLKQFKDKVPTAHINKNTAVHLYYIHSESVSNALDQTKVTFQRNTYWALLDLMKREKRDIFNTPPVSAEITRAMAKYIQRKEFENHKIMAKSPSNSSLVIPIHPLDELKLFENKSIM